MGQRNGFILLDKQTGFTSFQAITQVRKKIGLKKIGHTGTLDKFAEGLLILLCGKLTRLSNYITGMDKKYRCTIQFGATTETLDPEGPIIKQGRVPTGIEVEKTIKSFVGPQQQVPPRYSAVHVNGKRAYQLALKDADFELNARDINVYDAVILDYVNGAATVDFHCSKGTYIRSLARDIGAAIDSCAYLTALRRTAVGNISVSSAITIDDFQMEHDFYESHQLSNFFPEIKNISIPEKSISNIFQGKVLTNKTFDDPPTEDGLFCVVTKDEMPVAVVDYHDGKYSYICVFNP